MKILATYGGMAIALVTLTAMMVSVFLFVKNKGTIDALRDVAKTYQDLSVSYKAKIEMLEEELDNCCGENEDLKAQLLVERAALAKIADELIEGFERAIAKRGK